MFNPKDKLIFRHKKDSFLTIILSFTGHLIHMKLFTYFNSNYYLKEIFINY